jgi:hypothetical protein
MPCSLCHASPGRNNARLFLAVLGVLWKTNSIRFLAPSIGYMLARHALGSPAILLGFITDSTSSNVGAATEYLSTRSTHDAKFNIS